MKVIFLDIDGVINSERSFLGSMHRLDVVHLDDYMDDESYTQRLARITRDPIACGLINRILKRVNAHIVLSSTHRKHFKDEHFKDEATKLKKIQEYLSVLGIDGTRCIGWTPSLRKNRGEEIKHWIYEHPEVTHYVIIDDNSDMLPEQLANFVHVDSTVAFSASDYREACMILGEPDSSIVFL